MDRSGFHKLFAAVYEHSPWVAESVFDEIEETGLDILDMDAGTLAACFESAFLSAPRERQLAVIRAHPELACAKAGQTRLSVDSANEQAGAGLDQCSESEFEEFARLNAAYREKFGYPCIIAVRGLGRIEILNLLRLRLQNGPGLEFETAIQQVCRIAKFRIVDIFDD